MQLPEWLREAVDHEIAGAPAAELARAAAELSDAYRTTGPAGNAGRSAQRTAEAAAMNSTARRAAYLAVRLPATFAATHRVLRELRDLAPDWPVRRLLDLGAGPGTASFAAAEVWPGIEQFTLVERDAALIETGRHLAAEAQQPALRVAEWQAGDLAREVAAGAEFDVAVVSYVLNELSPAGQERVVAQAWRAAQVLVVVEPGTPHGFHNILTARDTLAGAGAHLVAPCPRAGAHACPMAEKRDWCHFAQRVERTSVHRRLKGGDLGYEDEKFSYVILSRSPIPTATARILRHPRIGKGHVDLELCTAGGVQRAVVTKRDKEAYRAARRARWGDRWER